MPRPRSHRLAIGGLAPALLLVAACSAIVAPSPTPKHGVVLDAQMSLQVSNGTTIAVDLFVNGAKMVSVPPNMVVSLPAQNLPPLPWSAEVRTAGGRALLAMPVRHGDVWTDLDGATQTQGDASHVDLSCGRIELWSGPEPSDSPPGSGQPGDCG